MDWQDSVAVVAASMGDRSLRFCRSGRRLPPHLAAGHRVQGRRSLDFHAGASFLADPASSAHRHAIELRIAKLGYELLDFPGNQFDIAYYRSTGADARSSTNECRCHFALSYLRAKRH